MRLLTATNGRMAILLMLSFCANMAGVAQIEHNPLQWIAIETGSKNINDSIKSQTNAQQKTGLLQATMAGEFHMIIRWEGKYNSYLKTARGYAEQLQAATSLFAEGVETLRHIHELKNAVAANPKGIGASLMLSNVYVETATELIGIYRILQESVSKGGEYNMLNGAERTEMLFALNDNLDRLNRKLRKMTLGIAFYNMGDVWKTTTAGMVAKTRAQIADDALDRWKRAQEAREIINK